MTDSAAFDLRFVLINEWPLLVGMALVTDFVCPRGQAQLVLIKTTMRIMAIVALNQPFVYSVMKRASELCTDVQVTSVAKLGRSIFQQKLRFLGMVR